VAAIGWRHERADEAEVAGHPLEFSRGDVAVEGIHAAQAEESAGMTGHEARELVVEEPRAVDRRPRRERLGGDLHEERVRDQSVRDAVRLVRGEQARQHARFCRHVARAVMVGEAAEDGGGQNVGVTVDEGRD
jgi:hypothetical protein